MLCLAAISLWSVDRGLSIDTRPRMSLVDMIQFSQAPLCTCPIVDRLFTADCHRLINSKLHNSAHSSSSLLLDIYFFLCFSHKRSARSLPKSEGVKCKYSILCGNPPRMSLSRNGKAIKYDLKTNGC